MKKNLFFLVAIVFVGVMVSCEKEIKDDVSVKNVPQMVEKKLWEHQLDYAMGHNTVTDFPLKMLGYKYLGVISDKNDVDTYMDYAFSDNSFIAIDSDRTDEHFEVFQRYEVIAGCAAQGLDATERFEKHRNQVANYISIGMTFIVEIYWNYKGVDFSTWALAEDGNKGFIYDNVASVARCPRPEAEVTWKKYCKKEYELISCNTRVINDSEEPIGVSYFHIGDHHIEKNIFGRYLWEYDIRCESKFSLLTGVYLGTNVMSATATHEEMWGCAAEIITISGEPMASYSHVFKWGYIYGFGPVSISVCGTGFTFNGNGDQRTEQVVHTVDTCSNVGL